MPWTDQPGPAPQRSEAELYAAVEQRAAAIRRRRRAGRSAGMGGAMAVLLVAFALVRAGDDSGSELRVVGDVVTSTTTTAVVPTTAMVLPPTTSAPPAPETSTTRPRATVTSTTRTTLRPSPATTAATAPTTTTTPPPLRMCDPADVVVTVTPDRPSYPVGATVNLLVAAQNRSSRPCRPMDPMLEIRDAAGTGLGGLGVADAFTMGIVGQPEPSWDPGETLSTTLPLSWLRCGEAANASCPPGTYYATASFGPFRSAPTPFVFA